MGLSAVARWGRAQSRARAGLAPRRAHKIHMTSTRAQGTPEGVEDNGSLTRVAAFPIGIDPERFARALDRADVKVHIAQLLNRYAGRKARPAAPAASPGPRAPWA